MAFEDLFGLGGYMGGMQGGMGGGDTSAAPTAEGKPAGLLDQWRAALADPKTQAALMAAGTQLMAPRWHRGSAFPDAMQGAATAQAAQATYEDQQAAEAAQLELKKGAQAQVASEGEKNRQSSERIAKTGADSRAEVANIRSAAMLERQNLINAAKTPAEMKLEADMVKAHVANQVKLWQSSIGDTGLKLPTAEQQAKWEAEGSRAATDRILSMRLRYGHQAPTTTGTPPTAEEQTTSPITSGNPSTGAAPGGGAGPASTAPTTSGSSAQKMTVDGFKSRMTASAWEAAMADPTAKARIMQALPPEEQTKLSGGGAPTGGTAAAGGTPDGLVLFEGKPYIKTGRSLAPADAGAYTKGPMGTISRSGTTFGGSKIPTVTAEEVDIPTTNFRDYMKGRK